MANVTDQTGTVPTPHRDLVILRERDLDTDLGEAIRRVRADAATQRAPILVIAPEQGEVGTDPGQILDVIGQGRRVAQAEAVRAVGERLQALTVDLRNLFVETERALRELEAEVDAAPPSAIRQRARAVGGVLEWVDAVVADLEQAAAACIAGRQPIDLSDLLAEVGADIERLRPGIRVQVVDDGGYADGPIADPAIVAQFAAAALDLVSDRIGGEGLIRVDVSRGRGGATANVLGVGVRCRIQGVEKVDAVRRLAVRAGARLHPITPGGEDGTGLGFSL